MKNSLQEYTETEFLDLLLASEEIEFSDDDLDTLVIFFNEKIMHPRGSALLTHPTMLGLEDSSEAIIQELKSYYQKKGIQCFKD